MLGLGIGTGSLSFYAVSAVVTTGLISGGGKSYTCVSTG